MQNFAYNIRRYFPFNSSEVKALTVTILFLTFVVSFNDNNEQFRLSAWMGHFLVWLIIVTVSVLVKQTGHRLVGLMYGFRVEYKLWWYGILIGLLMAFVSRGHIWLLIPGGITIHILKFHRLGWFRYGENIRAFSMICLSGPLANILFATFIKTLQLWFHLFPAGSPLVGKIFIFNLAFAAYSLLPIPPLDGSRVFFDSRMIYVFVFASVAAYAILAWLEVYSYLMALLIGVVIWLLYYVHIERK